MSNTTWSLAMTVCCNIYSYTDPNFDVKGGKNHFQYSLALAALHENEEPFSILELLLNTRSSYVNCSYTLLYY